MVSLVAHPLTDEPLRGTARCLGGSERYINAKCGERGQPTASSGTATGLETASNANPAAPPSSIMGPSRAGSSRGAYSDGRHRRGAGIPTLAPDRAWARYCPPS
jgi:hypothetical protein